MVRTHTDHTDHSDEPTVDPVAADAPAYRTAAELTAAVPLVEASPKGSGTLELIVRRPAVGRRELLDEAELSIDDGLVGDTWNQRASSRTEDRSPHPDMQLNLMNWRVITAIAGDSDDHRALAGDQLFVDLALDDDSLPTWTQLSIGADRGGEAVIEVTDQPHTGCALFTQRFGSDARRWVNSDVGARLHLRGVNARVVTPGTIRRGDQITIID